MQKGKAVMRKKDETSDARYVPSGSESDEVIRRSIASFYKNLKEDAAGYGPSSLVFDYFEQFSRRKTDRISSREFFENLARYRGHREKGISDRTDKQLLIRKGLRLVKSGSRDFSAVQFYSMFIEFIRGDVKLRSVREIRNEENGEEIETGAADKKNQEDGRFRECLIRFSDMFGIDGKDMPQDRVLDLLLKRLDDKDAEKCLYAGYLLRDVDGSTVYSSAAMSWIRFVLDAAIMNKVYDFFEALKKQEGKEKNTVDFLYLYYKFMAHSDHGGTDVSSAAIDTKMLAKIEKAAAFAASLDERTSRYFMIPVIVNGNALCGIYIMGTAFFSNEEEHVHGGPYAGLNVMNLQRVEEKSGRKWDPGHLSEEDFKGSTYFYDFSESLDPENVLAVFRDVSAMETVSAFLFRDNGSAPEGCPPEYAPYFCEQPGKSASEEAAEKMLQSADEAAERLHLKTCTQLQFR